MRLYHFVSYRIALFSPGYSPINGKCSGKCAQVSLPLSLSLCVPLSLSCSSTSSDIFRKISTKIYSILAEYLLPSLSHLTHIHATATGSGSFFLFRLSSLASRRASLVSPSFYAVSFPRVICIFLPFGLFMIPHGEQAHARSLFIP